MEQVTELLALLDPRVADTFTWNESTPLSSVKTLAITWAGYWTTILLLLWYMRGREGLKLDGVSAAHNLFLCIWSLYMFVFLLRELYLQYQETGLNSLFCTTSPDPTRPAIKYWLYIYYLSKFYELLDTVILILKKKKPLEFLHWYHHSIVVLMVWLWLEYPFMLSTSGMLVNTFVHVLMYYYYYRTSLRKSVWFKKHITQVQLAQFTLSFCLAGYYKYISTTEACLEEDNYVFLFSCLCNLSFLLLFANFYNKSYTGSPDKKKSDKARD